VSIRVYALQNIGIVKFLLITMCEMPLPLPLNFTSPSTKLWNMRCNQNKTKGEIDYDSFNPMDTYGIRADENTWRDE